MKKTILILTIGLLVVTLAGSCHKYPEDPFISFKDPGKRLNGIWQFTGYKINGTDHNHDFDSYLSPYSLTDCKIQFVAQTDAGSRWRKGVYHLYDGAGHEIQSDADYDMRSDANNIILYCDTAFRGHLWKLTVTNPQLGVGNAIWDIKELYQKHLHIKLNNADIYLRKQ